MIPHRNARYCLCLCRVATSYPYRRQRQELRKRGRMLTRIARPNNGVTVKPVKRANFD